MKGRIMFWVKIAHICIALAFNHYSMHRFECCKRPGGRTKPLGIEVDIADRSRCCLARGYSP